MANTEWMEMFPAARSEYLRFEGSDHRLVCTHFDLNLKKKKGNFRYDRSLSHKPEIRELVEQTWNQDGEATAMTKIDQVRRNLIAWVKAQAAEVKDKLQTNQALLEQALSEQCPNQDRILELKQLLEKTYAEEEAFWRQRNIIQWLNEGDRNSGFFHAVTRGRRARNKFSVIEDEEGQAFYEEDQIVSAFVTFYQKLFTAGTSDAISVVQESLSPKISQENNRKLIAIPEKSEVRDAVFSIHPDKAPGPDGFDVLHNS